MPKISNTRKQRAHVLLDRLRNGPALSAPVDGSALSVADATRAYRRWSETWVLDELADLVPELREYCRTCWQSPDRCECRKGLQHPG